VLALVRKFHETEAVFTSLVVQEIPLIVLPTLRAVHDSSLVVDVPHQPLTFLLLDETELGGDSTILAGLPPLLFRPAEISSVSTSREPSGDMNVAH